MKTSNRVKQTLLNTERLGLRVGEVASLLGVRPETVREWIARGELPAGRFGHTHFVSPEVLYRRLTAPWPGRGYR